MTGLNCVTIGGNLVRDPELKCTQGGTAVLSFCIAVNESRKKSDGWEDYPNFVDCIMFGERAKPVSGYLGKGTYVAVTGRLHQDRWEKDGQKRSKIEVVVDNIHFEFREQSVQQAQQDGVYDEDIPF